MIPLPQLRRVVSREPCNDATTQVFSRHRRRQAGGGNADPGASDQLRAVTCRGSGNDIIVVEGSGAHRLRQRQRRIYATFSRRSAGDHDRHRQGVSRHQLSSTRSSHDFTAGAMATCCPPRNSRRHRRWDRSSNPFGADSCA